MTRIGSLFSGYGGLDMGVQAVIGGTVAWHVEFDEAPSRILAHHWPDVPNYGDITKVDWSQVEPVDVLTGGFPCQDVSLAGARKGLKEGTRSGLWSHFAEAINQLQPGLVVIENVRGLLSAEAGGSVEPDPWGVGDGATRPVINALGAVLGDLAELGYDADWVGVRAAETGSPHGRYRLFILAHAAGVGRAPWRAEPARVEGRPHAEFRGSQAATHTDGFGREWSERGSQTGPPAAQEHPAADTGSERGDEGNNVAGLGGEGADRASVVDEHSPRPGGAEWGVYLPAIRRWESVLSRTAPAPTNPDGKNGSHRLSARFVEWMMGLPEGHVTDPAIGLTRNEQLKALGNGVVPQQAALALSILTKRMEVAA